MHLGTRLLCLVGTGAALGAMALASPEDWHVRASPVELVTVDGVDYPVCATEDCSDQVGSVGVWRDPDTGTEYLSIGEDLSIRIEA